MPRLQSVQVLRFIAAAMVVAAHALPLPVGSAGVDVFFVLSGFVIPRGAAGATAREFLRGRAIRILPPYYLFALPWLCIGLANGGLPPARVISTVTLAPLTDDLLGSVLPQAWTLSFEALFYGAFALGLAVPRLRRWLPAAYLAALAGALATHWAPLRFVGNPLVIEFWFGWLISRGRTGFPRLGALAVVAAVAAFAWMAMHGDDGLAKPLAALSLDKPWRFLTWGVPAALLVWGVLQFEEALASPAWRLPVHLGDAAYSIYLTNLLVVLLAQAAPPPVRVLLALGVGALAYRYVEAPVLKRLRRASGESPARRPAAGASGGRGQAVDVVALGAAARSD